MFRTSFSRAFAANYALAETVQSVSILETHLGEVVRRYAHELFARQEATKLMDRVAEQNPKVVEKLVPKLLSLAVVQKVLQNRLRERVSIRDGGTILEALRQAAPITKNAVLLTEYVRQAILRQIVRALVERAGNLTAYFLDPALEQAIEPAVEHTEYASHLNLAPQRIRNIQERIKNACGPAESGLVQLTSSGSHSFVRQITEGTLTNMTALSHNGMPRGIRIVSLGTVS